MRSHAEVVIIGGGVTGCAVAWHLAKAGVEVTLLERTELTAGSTWHAAGGCGAFGGAANAAYLHKYSFELCPQFERETDQSVGLHHVGEVTLGRTDARMDQMTLQRTLARRAGVKTCWLSPEEIAAKAPVLDLATIRAALFEPSYGHVDPAGVTHAFTNGARDHGAEVIRQAPVLETNLRPDRAWDVVTPRGIVRAERVVNAAGLWAREVGALAGLRLPLMPVEHHYFVTEAIPEVAALDFELRLVTDANAEYYMRQEGQGLLGVYEDHCTHWAEAGTPLGFSHELLPDDLGRIERNLVQEVESVPCLGTAGIKRVINGPMILSPDLAPLIGPVPGLPNYWAACGVMSGFSQAAAIGMVTAASRLSPQEFLLVGSGVADRFHLRWWADLLPPSGVRVESLAASLCGLSVTGARARALLQKLVDADLSPEAWRYEDVGRVQAGPAAEIVLMRVSYTGELGWELWALPESHLPLLEALLAAGEGLSVTLAGVRALNSLRIEKGFGAWGLEYSPDHTPWEAGMGRIVRLDKGDFVGRDAAARAQGEPTRRLRQLDVDADGAEPWGGEPILQGDRIVGFLTSAAFGHRVGRCVALGYLDAGADDGLFVEVLGERRPVRVRDRAAFDPEGRLMRG